MELVEIIKIYSKKKDLHITLNQFIILYLLYDKQFSLINNTFIYLSEDLDKLHYNTFISLSDYKDDLKDIVITSKTRELFINSNSSLVEEIVNHLNKVTKSRYSAKTPSTIKLINARLKENTLEEIKGVIDVKTIQWLNTSSELYLRPETLFNSTKFEGYVNEYYRTKKDEDNFERM